MESTKNWLNTFWAVTASSLFQAHIYGEGEIPRVTKIAGRDSTSEFPVGETMTNGTMLAICKRLVLFIPEGGGAYSSMQRELVKVNTGYWGGHTSELVAVFLNEEDARICYSAKALRHLDPRWQARTIETLRTIGKDHPYCSISTYFDGRPGCSDFDALVHTNEWQ